MTTELDRRLARLEQAAGAADAGILERELSVEGQKLLREALGGLYQPEEIERLISPGRRAGPASISAEGRRQLEETVAGLRTGRR